MLIPVLIGSAVAAAVLVAKRPGTFHIERSLVIAAPAARAFAEVNDFRAWARWSPYEQLDPQLQRTYSGPSSGEGAEYAWSGNGKAGAGRMVITRSVPNEQINIRLEFTKPFAATHEASFKFQPMPDGTLVTWAMDGQNNFGAKLFQLVVNMDKLLGRDFERGLTNLKTLLVS
jgi:hypothetical protein